MTPSELEVYCVMTGLDVSHRAGLNAESNRAWLYQNYRHLVELGVLKVLVVGSGRVILDTKQLNRLLTHPRVLYRATMMVSADDVASQWLRARLHGQ